MSWDINAFREKLEDQHSFPGIYIFKFIVPTGSVSEVEALWGGGQIELRASRNGKYTSVTIQGTVQTAEQVISIYLEANKIEGCIAL